MLTLCYGFNSIGCFIETVYLVNEHDLCTNKSLDFHKKATCSVQFLGLWYNLCGYKPNPKCSSYQPIVFGWINVVFIVCVFAAPLSIMRLVIETECGIHVIPFVTRLNTCCCYVVLLWPIRKGFVHSGTKHLRIRFWGCADDDVLSYQNIVKMITSQAQTGCCYCRRR